MMLPHESVYQNVLKCPGTRSNVESQVPDEIGTKFKQLYPHVSGSSYPIKSRRMLNDQIGI